MALIESIIARAKSNKQRIVLPESLEERTLTAADKSLADDIADIILIGNPDEIFALADKLGLKNIGKATIIDPATSDKTEEYAQLLFQLRQKCLVKFFSVLKLFRGNAYSFYIVLLRSLQCIGTWIVADDQRYFCICDLSAVNGIQDSLQVCAASGNQYADF